MEELLLAGIALCVIAIIYGVGKLVVVYRRSKQREAERRIALEARLEQIRQEAYTKVRKVNSMPISKPKVVNTVPPTPVYTPSVQERKPTVTSSDDGFVAGMLTQMLIDSTIESIKHGTDPDTGKTYDREIERSVGVSKSESSWGYDDSDSRKSVSDTFSSSSSDSWSSSSSDSGPSSDW